MKMQNSHKVYLLNLTGCLVGQVTELAPLRSLLECLREPALRCSFSVSVLCDLAIQVTDGMSYLEGRRLIHRDLAARNVLMFARDKVGGNTMKEEGQLELQFLIVTLIYINCCLLLSSNLENALYKSM